MYRQEKCLNDIFFYFQLNFYTSKYILCIFSIIIYWLYHSEKLTIIIPNQHHNHKINIVWERIEMANIWINDLNIILRGTVSWIPKYILHLKFNVFELYLLMISSTYTYTCILKINLGRVLLMQVNHLVLFLLSY